MHHLVVHPVSGNHFSSDAATGLVRVSTRKTWSLYLPERQMCSIEIYRMDHLVLVAAAKWKYATQKALHIVFSRQ